MKMEQAEFLSALSPALGQVAAAVRRLLPATPMPGVEAAVAGVVTEIENCRALLAKWLQADPVEADAPPQKR
jgi:hypothetical protein